MNKQAMVMSVCAHRTDSKRVRKQILRLMKKLTRVPQFKKSDT
jgi:hypothetical protein